ncbi:trehalase [Rhizoctonia solani AG-1 IA]|uniref:Trehalase n=1 Tax=Thanatephorus cucumeris (strain AG1-IA) TaxID=983506 RepID=L8WV72_THACA|nr:trehalase [Rhizoctonia solani AG-1 IA]
MYICISQASANSISQRHHLVDSRTYVSQWVRFPCSAWVPYLNILRSNDFQREKSWKRIYDGFINGRFDRDTVTSEDRWKDILIAAHNYAIVGAESMEAHRCKSRYVDIRFNNTVWTDALKGGGLLTISWGLVCNLFESVYLNWDPNMFSHSRVIHGMWRPPTDESGEHSGMNEIFLITSTRRVLIYCLASNHHYRLRYSNPNVFSGSQPPEIWVLLTRHVLSKETKADFIALHHFSHTEAGGLPRADQVPNKVSAFIRIKDTPSDEIISLIAARDGSGPETGYTLSIYSHAKIEIEAITKVLGYIKTVSLIELVFANFLDLVQAKGNFTSKSAGGNASLPTFMNNPQYRVRIGNGTEGGSRGRVPVKLTVEGARTLPLNMKLVWSGGKRVSDVVAGDVILDSGAYNFGLACTEGEVQCRAGQQGEYALRVECDASVEISLLPPEGAVSLIHPRDAASAMGGPSSGKYEHNPTFEIAVSSPTQVSARLQIISKQQSSLPPPPALNLTLFERNPQGLPGKQVATSGAYSDAVSGVMLPDTYNEHAKSYPNPIGSAIYRRAHRLARKQIDQAKYRLVSTICLVSSYRRGIPSFSADRTHLEDLLFKLFVSSVIRISCVVHKSLQRQHSREPIFGSHSANSALKFLSGLSCSGLDSSGDLADLHNKLQASFNLHRSSLRSPNMKGALNLWLTLAFATATLSYDRPSASIVMNDRAAYHAYALNDGMCNQRGNPQRSLVIPGPEIVSQFSVCQGRNEFGELVSDTSGSVYCNGTTTSVIAKPLSIVPHHPGKELTDYENSRFPHTPSFILSIRPQARTFRAWTKIVHHYWNNLDRTMIQNCFNDKTYGTQAQLLPGPGSPSVGTTLGASGYSPSADEQCATSIIRLEHPFVIAGGRFREQYYWDSFFVMEGLLAANMTYLARTTLLNFMDEIRSYGFIPNGGRITTGRALEQKELRWWAENRGIAVKSPRDSSVTHFVYHYNVNADGPRPEVSDFGSGNEEKLILVVNQSYAEDWMTAWCDEQPPTREEEFRMYSELASGAESGWDYTARWMSDPYNLPEDRIEQMRRVQIRRIIPVDLNSILYRCHILIAELYERAVDDESPYAWQHKQRHEIAASLLKSAILDLHWNENKTGFYDFELDTHGSKLKGPRTGRIKNFWSGATFTPFWSGIWPESVRTNQSRTMEAFSGMRDLLKRATACDCYQVRSAMGLSGCDTPSQGIIRLNRRITIDVAIKALQNIPYNLSTADAFRFAKTSTPQGQLGVEYDKLPVMDGENITGRELDGSTSSSWRNVMLKENVTAKLRDDEIEAIVQDNPREDAWLDHFPGAMYEKLNAWDVTRRGHGGEYEVQTGFGWTNGVAIWIAHVLGTKLDDPVCPMLPSNLGTQHIVPTELVIQS